jgi:hypothetical protein
MELSSQVPVGATEPPFIPTRVVVVVVDDVEVVVVNAD